MAAELGLDPLRLITADVDCERELVAEPDLADTMAKRLGKGMSSSSSWSSLGIPVRAMYSPIHMTSPVPTHTHSLTQVRWIVIPSLFVLVIPVLLITVAFTIVAVHALITLTIGAIVLSMTWVHGK